MDFTVGFVINFYSVQKKVHLNRVKMAKGPR